MATSREQVYEAMRRADAAGDAESVRSLAAYLKQSEHATDAQFDEGLTGSVTDESGSRPRSTVRDLGTATAQTGAAAVKGLAYPEEIARTVRSGANYGLKALGGGALDLLGFDSAADWWRGAVDAEDRDMSRRPTVRSAVERVVPAPQDTAGKVRDFIAEIAGASLIPLAPKPVVRAAIPVERTMTATSPKAIPHAADVIEAGKREGVRVMTSDVRPPTTAIGKKTRSFAEQIPYAGTGGPRAKQEVARQEAVRNVLRDFGGDDAVQLFDDAPSAIDDIAKSLASRRSRQLKTFKRQKETIIEGVPGIVPIDRTLTKIDEQIAHLKSINETAYAPFISKLEGFKAELANGKTLSQIEGNRKLLGDVFKNQDLAHIAGDGQKALNAIYPSLNAEMGTFIRNRAGVDAFNNWKNANTRLAELAGELKSGAFKKALSSTETTPEAVGRLLFNRDKSEVRRLVSNLDAVGRQRAQAAILQRAFEKAGGSPETLSVKLFSNNIKGLSDQIGIVFEGADKARLEGLTRLLNATQRAADASAAPATGAQNTPIIGGYALGTLLGHLAVPFAGIGGLMARAYESAPVRNLLVGLSRTKPGTRQESAYIQRLIPAITAISQRAANENAPGAVSRLPERALAEEEVSEGGGAPPQN